MDVLKKYKVCPVCGGHNDPRLMECDTCGTDLMGIPVVDAALEKVTAPEGSVYVRICECGYANPSQARKCEACGEDISDIIPVEKKSKQTLQYRFCDLAGQYEYTIPLGTAVIGREHEMREYLSEKSYVSRAHAKVMLNEEGLFIENLSRTNYTYVNNIRICDGKVPLKNQDEVSLGGISLNGTRQEQAAYFRVETIE